MIFASSVYIYDRARAHTYNILSHTRLWTHIIDIYLLYLWWWWCIHTQNYRYSVYSHKRANLRETVRLVYFFTILFVFVLGYIIPNILWLHISYYFCFADDRNPFHMVVIIYSIQQLHINIIIQYPSRSLST